MIRKAFPDITSLKRLIRENYANKKGWPTAILNVNTRHDYRPDVKGALSIFMNLKGTSNCTVENRRVAIPEPYFFVTNQQQYYTLEIEADQTVETFNIHFADKLVEQVYESLLLPTDFLLKNPDGIPTPKILFYNQLHRKEAKLMQLIYEIYHSQYYQTNSLSLSQQFTADKAIAPVAEAQKERLWLEEKLYEILVYLLQLHRNILRKVEQMPPVKKSTRTELYRRLSFALDYLHSFAYQAINLDDLAQTACLSKYHFLRLFKQIFGITPHQYLSKIRLENAQNLLKNTTLTIHEIAYTIGYENATSFCRVFQQRFKISPQKFREKV